MNNILSEINIGFDLSNIRKIVNVTGNVLGLTNTVHVMPMKKVLDENAYVMGQQMTGNTIVLNSLPIES